MDAYTLSLKHTVEELVAMDKAICDDLTNWNPPGSFWVYIKKARKKREEIAWAISYRRKAKQ